jgi:hypothetical protein
MEQERRSLLDRVCFSDIVERIETKASLLGAPKPCSARDSNAASGASRAVFSIDLPDTIGDLLHNGRDGLRARYWHFPEIGAWATRLLLERLRECLGLLDSLPDGFDLTKDAVAKALNFPSAKIWVSEDPDYFYEGEGLLNVCRWAANENDQCNPRMWRWTPRATIFEIKSAFITPQGCEWVPKCKEDRSRQINRWGFT